MAETLVGASEALEDEALIPRYVGNIRYGDLLSVGSQGISGNLTERNPTVSRWALLTTSVPAGLSLIYIVILVILGNFFNSTHQKLEIPSRYLKAGFEHCDDAGQGNQSASVLSLLQAMFRSISR